ncbi:hypothetical protein CC78DRAFT_537459, partial [Lojkania enalia]
IPRDQSNASTQGDTSNSQQYNGSAPTDRVSNTNSQARNNAQNRETTPHNGQESAPGNNTEASLPSINVNDMVMDASKYRNLDLSPLYERLKDGSYKG